MNLHVRTAAADPETLGAMVETVRRELRLVDSRLPVLELVTFKRFHENSIELWALGAGGRMLMTFGVLALALAVAGVYGVRSYLVSRRTREIGIRMALGAKPRDVFRMVMRESLALTAAGLAFGIPLAMLMGTLLGAILPDVSGFDPLGVIAAPLVLAAASLLASYLPARRATQVNPLSALRAE
jgi:ABC-type antimicrobial peptide transport system permease subunit